MGSLIGLKNLLIFSAVLLTIGSVSAQQAFAGQNCRSDANGDWNNPDSWTDGCPNDTPNISDDTFISHEIVITGDEEVLALQISGSGTLFIDCDASLTIDQGGTSRGNITNHGDLTGNVFTLFAGTLFNSGTISGVVVDEKGDGSIVEISTKCSQPIGGTVGSMDTVSLLVAGAQANTGWWIIALVGAVALVGIAYKAKSNKTDKETL